MQVADDSVPQGVKEGKIEITVILELELGSYKQASTTTENRKTKASPVLFCSQLSIKFLAYL